MNNAIDPKTGFDIGWDYAVYSMPRPETLCPEVIDGYFAKRDQGCSTKKPSYYQKKWLSLRLHAYNRGIYFDPELDESVLEKLVEQQGNVCPITQEEMTKGALLGSDISIDRVLNNYGYTECNCVAMSQQANEAKADLSIEQVKQIRDSRKSYHGLSTPCWARLFDLMADYEIRFNRYLEASSTNLTEKDLAFTIIDLMTDISGEPEEASDAFFTLVEFATQDLTSKQNKEFCKLIKKIFTKRNKGDHVVSIDEFYQLPSHQRLVDKTMSFLNTKYLCKDMKAYAEARHQKREEVLSSLRISRV